MILCRPRISLAIHRLMNGGMMNRQGRRVIDRGFLSLCEEGPKGFGKFNRKKKVQSDSDRDNKDKKDNEGDESDKDIEKEGKQPEKQESDKDKKLKDFKEFQKKIEEEMEKLSKEQKEKSGSKKKDEKIKIHIIGSSTNEKDKGNNATPPPPPPNNRKLKDYLVMIMIGTAIFMLVVSSDSHEMSKETTIDLFFNEYIREGYVDEVNVTRTLVDGSAVLKITFTPRGGDKKDKSQHFFISNLEHFLVQLKEKAGQKQINVNFNYEFTDKVSNMISSLLQSDFINIILTLLLVFLFRKMRSLLSNVSNQQKFDEKNNQFMKRLKNDALKKGTGTNLSFNDVAGMDEAKKEITEFVDFLKNKEQYIRLGAKIPRGALLTGPPGTGKTLLAKACANESKVPFLSVPASEFVEIYGGVGASRVRALFEVARQHAPCIIFIDEIDAIGKKRSSNSGMGGNEERENTLNQLLVEMDGFETQTNIVVFAATNIKDTLDPALLRPGRFDRIIDVPLPDIEARKKIFMVHLSKITLHPSKKIDEYANRLATLTPGFSGAQIENICNEAAIITARKDGESVQQKELEQAVERVIAGLEKKNRADLDQRRLVAIHESGHGVVSWFLKNGPPLLKLTIIPRSKGAKGFAQYLPNEGFLTTKQDMLDSICIALAGTLSEDIFIGNRSVGASDDLKKVQDIAHRIVTTFGMTELGPVPFYETEWGYRSYSEESNVDIDEMKLKIVRECEERTRQMITEKKELITKLSDRLLEKETLTFKEIRDILGERPFAPKGSFKSYLEESNHETEDSQNPRAERREEGPKAISLDVDK